MTDPRASLTALRPMAPLSDTAADGANPLTSSRSAGTLADPGSLSKRKLGLHGSGAGCPGRMRQNNKNSTLPREGVEMLQQDVSSGSSGRPIAQAWDPYDVWLQRVKLPRERQPQRVAPVMEAQAVAANETRATGEGTDDAMLLPGVS